MDTASVIVAIVIAVIGLVGVGAGVAATFGGVVYAERKRDEREQEARDREVLRDSLRGLRDATLTYEAVSTELLIERLDAWIAQPAGPHTWKQNVPTGELWLRWAAAGQALGAAHFELEDRNLADQVYALQAETSAMINEGPQSESPAHMNAYGDRVGARADQSAGVARAIGAAIRQASA